MQLLAGRCFLCFGMMFFENRPFQMKLRSKVRNSRFAHFGVAIFCTKSGAKLICHDSIGNKKSLRQVSASFSLIFITWFLMGNNFASWNSIHPIPFKSFTNPSTPAAFIAFCKVLASAFFFKLYYLSIGTLLDQSQNLQSLRHSAQSVLTDACTRSSKWPT